MKEFLGFLSLLLGVATFPLGWLPDISGDTLLSFWCQENFWSQSPTRLYIRGLRAVSKVFLTPKLPNVNVREGDIGAIRTFRRSRVLNVC